MPIHQVETVDESFLATLGIHRIEIPVPFIEAGGPANVYAIENEDRSFTLFDTGVNTVEGKAALRIGLSLAGVEVSRITRLIISHGHIDHYGNAEMLAQESGAAVFIHSADLEKICGHGSWATMLKEHWQAMLELGVPLAVLEAMYDRTNATGGQPPQVKRERVRTIEHQAPLHFRQFDAEVLHFPGHTPGLICLHAPAQKLLFADDHVLARVSPNPLLDFSQGSGATKFKALCRYLEGARLVHDMPLDCVLPGHGPGFRGHRELLQGLFDFYVERQQKLLERIRQSPVSVYELVPILFPRVPPQRLYLTISEVVGNIEVLEAQGAIRKVVSDGIARYQVA